MGPRSRRNKRKNSSESDLDSSVYKQTKHGGSDSSGHDTQCCDSIGEGTSRSVTVSELLGEVGAVLYPEDTNSAVFVASEGDSLQGLEASGGGESAADGMSVRSTESGGPGEGGEEPGSQGELSISDVMGCLRRIEKRLDSMDRRLDGLEEVKVKVGRFETETRKLWAAMEDRNKKLEGRLDRVEERGESCDFAVGVLSEKVVTLEKEKDALKDELVYLKGQSMRNNLLFSGIPESPTESNDETEVKLRDFIVHKMKVAQDLMDNIKFERVHRIGQKQDGRGRKIEISLNNLPFHSYLSYFIILSSHSSF